MKQKLAFFLADRCGSASRASELKAHLEDSGECGLRDIASLAGLMARANAGRVGMELVWFLVGIPAAIAQLCLLVFTYETHFPAWDFVGPDEVVWTSEAQMWNNLVEAMWVLSVIMATVGFGRVIRGFSQGRFRLALGFGLIFVGALTQMERFVDRAVWYRDTDNLYWALEAEHVNVIQPYSIALFAAFAAIPMLYVVADVIAVRRLRRPASVANERLPEGQRR